MSYLPGILAEIAAVAGEPAALAIADKKGGQRVWIPYDVPADHWLAEIVGAETARRIGRHFGVIGASDRQLGADITVPLGPAGIMRRARRRLAEELLAGADPAVAAARAGLHVRTAFRMQARLRQRQNSLQGELF